MTKKETGNYNKAFLLSHNLPLEGKIRLCISLLEPEAMSPHGRLAKIVLSLYSLI